MWDHSKNITGDGGFLGGHPDFNNLPRGEGAQN